MLQAGQGYGCEAKHAAGSSYGFDYQPASTVNAAFSSVWLRLVFELYLRSLRVLFATGCRAT
jgi:hypothetical protein